MPGPDIYEHSLLPLYNVSKVIGSNTLALQECISASGVQSYQWEFEILYRIQKMCSSFSVYKTKYAHL